MLRREQPRSSRVVEEVSTTPNTIPVIVAESSGQANRSLASVGRLQPSGDEAGTPPGDRAFRPDILGLRAVAVVLVVLVHVHVTFLRGGFIGVDVFFVISGFVITGLLLRERYATGKTNILAFYGRRARRIIPAAMLVIVVTVIAERLFVGAAATPFVASQARWASVFLGNYSQHINVFNPLQSPLGAYWSLAVEEQFYLVYPMLLVVVAAIARHRSLRVKLGVLLGLTVASSFTWTVISSRGIGFLLIYFSPFTHAWELAMGGLLAVCSGWLKKLPLTLAAVMTWVGLVAVVVAAVVIQRPGYLAAVPVCATSLIIAGGTAAPRWGVEWLLRLPPFKWLGLWSFSLYLWHFPILIVASQHWGHATVMTNLLLVGGAIALSAGTYFAIENPIRHSSFLTRFPLASLAGGAGLIVAGLAIVNLAS